MDGKLNMAVQDIPLKLIVMPFVPEKQYCGTGLGLHFFVGNLICLNNALVECWFGWRVKNIFSSQADLEAYCTGDTPWGDIFALGAREKVRFWMEGRYAVESERVQLTLTLYDVQDQVEFSQSFSLDPSDGYAGFRTQLFDWFKALGLKDGGRSLGLWPEKISIKGLDLLGTALGSLYISYVEPGDRDLDVAPFSAAVKHAPQSYLAWDLLGWAKFKNTDIQGAQQAFEKSLTFNENGMGAFAGLMWCALARKDRGKMLGYALEKGRCRGDDPEKAHALVAKKMG